MKWASAIADGKDLTTALGQCAQRVAADLGAGAPAALAVVFVSVAYAGAFDQVPAILRAHFPDAWVMGCSAAGVIGGGVEVEDRPAVSLTAGHLPGVRITPLRATADNLPTPDDPPGAWQQLAGVTPQDRPDFLILLDPFSAPAEALLAGLDFAFPGAHKVGGLASGGQTRGANALFADQAVYRDGAVGVALAGDIVVDTVVAQGCRPVGEPMRITRCRQNLLLEVDGSPPITALQELYKQLPRRDREMVQNGNLFLGIAMDTLPTLYEARAGDFLIRNVVGADQERGVLAIGETLREGQLVQFHVRDAITSAEDLQAHLRRYAGGPPQPAPVGALMFQCNGRGRHLYGQPNHDAGLFKDCVGSVPLGGFFCNGEIGPVGNSTYLHGYTSSIALFRKP